MKNLSYSFKSITLAIALTLGFILHCDPASAGKSETLVVAGGCFWCVESDFESVSGVIEAVSGYTGGTVANPTYKIVSKGGSGHFEAVKITYDSAKIDRSKLLDLFLRSVDVTDAGGQFCDRGDSYRTAIFVSNQAELDIANAAISKAQTELGQKIVTPVLNAKTFYVAEANHQNYYKGNKRVLTRFGPVKQSTAYEKYRKGCGRDAKVLALWGSAAPFAQGH
ncbi:peptide-methionine (S)-S-oxide reductase MsrA [Falsihalocynthiibacter sp. S25ZX9]|uniref:peptide-methionine (S)-S-oxide reductase MsrA n=1 Tax=Falsihalocynthiibacter sp. S25ZX9 TaxID=3240870 RepID=UPI00350EA7D5